MIMLETVVCMFSLIIAMEEFCFYEPLRKISSMDSYYSYQAKNK